MDSTQIPAQMNFQKKNTNVSHQGKYVVSLLLGHAKGHQ